MPLASETIEARELAPGRRHLHGDVSSSDSGLLNILDAQRCAKPCLPPSACRGRGIKGREKFPQYGAINISRATQDPPNGLLRFTTKQQWAPAGGNWGWYFNQQV